MEMPLTRDSIVLKLQRKVQNTAEIDGKQTLIFKGRKRGHFPKGLFDFTNKAAQKSEDGKCHTRAR